MQDHFYSSLPENPGVYLFKDKQKRIIYVGKAKNIKHRVSSYFTKGQFESLKTALLVRNISSVDYIPVISEIEAFLLEANLIKKYKPFYNIKLADDSSYPYIRISKEQIPYVRLTRKQDELNAEYFGPYPDVSSVKVVLKLVRKIFPYQSVINHPKKKCLYYHLSQCPCIPLFPQRLAEYRKTIKKIKYFLQGDTQALIKSLERERDVFSKKEMFEKASEIQDQIEQIKIITGRYFNPFQYENNPSFYYERVLKEVESLLSILKKYYPGLKTLDRVECYDISNIQGTNPTGSMVVFENGYPNKKQYRKFRIRTKHTPDDYLMMKEVLLRRLGHDEWSTPSLMVVDGGKGQVGTAFSVLRKAQKHIPLIGLAKREETIVVPEFTGLRVEFIEENLSLETPGINLLRRIRDEAHRFAITYHRLLRKKKMLGLTS